MALERLQKILARAGVSSRRAAEVLIEEGRVRVDGRVVRELGTKADARRQNITVNGRRVEAEPFVYVMFHKPRGVVCTMSDPEGRETVAAYVTGAQGRVVPVGRLDYHTSGLLLLTNDGDFAAALLDPKHAVPKQYVAKVRGVLTDADVERWQQPIDVEGVLTRPAEVRRLRVEEDKTWLEITLREGKNRHIHRLGEATGNTVLRLARVAFAGLSHEGLRPGQWRYLSKEELTDVKKTYGVPKRIWPAPPLPNQQQIRRARAKNKGPSSKGVVDGAPLVKKRSAARASAVAKARAAARGKRIVPD